MSDTITCPICKNEIKRLESEDQSVGISGSGTNTTSVSPAASSAVSSELGERGTSGYAASVIKAYYCPHCQKLIHKLPESF